MEHRSVCLSIANLNLRANLERLINRAGFQVILAEDNDSVLKNFHVNHPNLLILETDLPNCENTLEVIRQIKLIDRRLPIILLATHKSESLVIAALRCGVKDYFTQPFSENEIFKAVQRCLKTPSITVNAPHKLQQSIRKCDLMIGESHSIRKLRSYVLKTSAVDSNVLITGETGTGKELVAKSIHQKSKRHNMAMISINCAAIPDNLLESELFGYEKGAFTGAFNSYPGKLRLANGGTVFLDEIGDMSPYSQAKILRAIETMEIFPIGGRKGYSIDVRFIAATNQNLEQLITQNGFRKDLFYRFNVARVELPPLRERKEDIPLLIEHFLKQFNLRFGKLVAGLSREALDSVMRYDWPGNIRELKNMLEAIYIDPPESLVTVDDLPEKFRDIPATNKEKADLELHLLLTALKDTNWNKRKAAEKLNWSRMTLYRKMAKYQIAENRNNDQFETSAINY